MNALERKAMRLFEKIGVDKINQAAADDTKLVGVSCIVRWKGDGCVCTRDIAISTRSTEDYGIDEDFFFTVSNVGEFISLLANLDFVFEDFNEEKDWQNELATYGQAEDFDAYFNSREDFDIVDVFDVNIYDRLMLIEQPQKPQHKEYFEVVSVSRADLEMRGFDTSNVTDEQMEILAIKMGSAYLDDGYWVDLEIIANDYLEIPKKTTLKSGGQNYVTIR